VFIIEFLYSILIYPSFCTTIISLCKNTSVCHCSDAVVGIRTPWLLGDLFRNILGPQRFSGGAGLFGGRGHLPGHHVNPTNYW